MSFSLKHIQYATLPALFFCKLSSYKIGLFWNAETKLKQTEFYDANYEDDNETIVLIPKSATQERTVLWLHGLGDKTKDHYEIFLDDTSPFPTNYKFILPQAEKKCMQCLFYWPMTAWHNISSKDIPDEKDMKNSAKRLGTIIDEEVSYYKEKYGEEGAKGKIIIAGQSMGCIMGYYLGLTYPRPEYQKAIVGFSGPFLTCPVFNRLEYPDYHEGENFKLPMLYVVGTKDWLISIEEFDKKQNTTGFLKKSNFEDIKIEGQGHEMEPVSNPYCREFIKKLD